ncbi:MAG: NADP-dependent glyceraldehyde-3-phosphate dehydrogenase, partial [Gammaproteobacteria bacterium]|nr:NADP-dependent glyceraldehyde-3-phosphate dehydrogenase [Gammaproteobacteria bacterium]MBU1556467.1 NADP-dependent glyceraldehyde-3-phosphate dehydrogenase [Gammaproteobacteria bacterium]
MSLATVFPQAADIPAEFAHKGEITQREYLVNGELVQWPGDLSPVVSPVYLRNEHNDELQQVVLGHTPLLDADTALKALDSAVKAYDLGRGAWP